jgi:hypothetical protein
MRLQALSSQTLLRAPSQGFAHSALYQGERGRKWAIAEGARHQTPRTQKDLCGVVLPLPQSHLSVLSTSFLAWPTLTGLDACHCSCQGSPSPCPLLPIPCLLPPAYFPMPLSSCPPLFPCPLPIPYSLPPPAPCLPSPAPCLHPTASHLLPPAWENHRMSELEGTQRPFGVKFSWMGRQNPGGEGRQGSKGCWLGDSSPLLLPALNNSNFFFIFTYLLKWDLTT